MTSLLADLDSFLNKSADARTADWPLVGSLVPVAIIIVSYLYFVIKCGPDYMRDKKPYDLKLIISAYNLVQILACIYIFSELLASGWYNDYSLGCQPLDRTTSPKAMRMARVTWWIFILKLTEFIETVFFVLRKKQNQITTLHLYHHVSTLLVGWMCVKFSPGGMTTFSVMPNCLVHVLMYGYYLVSVHASKQLQQKLNKWKRYLTVVQMIQFCVIILHSAQAFAPSCDINKFVFGAYVPNVFFLFYLFLNFYKKSYKRAVKTN